MSGMNSFLNDERYEKMIGMYPELKYPLEDADIARFFARVQGISPETKYVAKSEKIAVLEQERELCSRLMEQCKAAMSGAEMYCRKDKVGAKRIISGITDDTRAEVGKIAAGIKKLFSERETELVPLFQAYLQKLEEIDDILLRELSMEKKGLAGENAVESAIKQLGNKVILLSNLVLKDTHAGPDAAKTAETDALVLTPDRIWVCEIKNYGRDGDVVYLYEDLVKVCDRNDCLLKNHTSPFIQNSRHNRVVNQVLTDAGYEGVKISPVVIIANPNVTLINKTDFYVVTPDQFAELAASWEPCYTREQMASMKDALLGSAMPERKFPITTVSEICKDLDALLDDMISVRSREIAWESKIVDTLNGEIVTAAKKLPWKEKYPLLFELFTLCIVAWPAIVCFLIMMYCSHSLWLHPNMYKDTFLKIGTLAMLYFISFPVIRGLLKLFLGRLIKDSSNQPLLIGILFDPKVWYLISVVLAFLATVCIYKFSPGLFEVVFAFLRVGLLALPLGVPYLIFSLFDKSFRERALNIVGMVLFVVS